MLGVVVALPWELKTLTRKTLQSEMCSLIRDGISVGLSGIGPERAYAAAALLFSIVTIGLGLIVVIPVGIAAVVAALVFLIQASIRAANGEDYRYPLTLRFVS